jgi:hypothetical protein
MIAGAILGAIAGGLLGRHLCREAAPSDTSCVGAIVLVGAGGGLAGALIGYVVGSGTAPSDDPDG